MRPRLHPRFWPKVVAFTATLILAPLTLSATASASIFSFFGEQVACITRNFTTHLFLAGPICLFGAPIKWLFDQLASLVGILIEGFIRLIMSALTWNPQFYPLYTTGCDVAAGACASQGISHLVISIMTVLMPLYVMLILYTGVQIIFLSLTPQGRARAKARFNEFIISMVVVSLSPILYQIILDIGESIVYAILAVAIDSLSSEGTDLAGFLIGFMVLVRILLPFSIWLLLLSLVTLIVIFLRYVMVMLYGVLFPAILFLYLWEATKPIGAKFLRTSIMWIFVPVAQAIFMALVIISLVQAGSTIGTPLVDAEEALFDFRFADAWSHVKDLGPGLIEALKSMLLVAAGLVGIVLAPFMMSGLLQIMGGAIGFMGTASVPHREVSGGGAALVGAGTLVMGAGADSLIAAGATAGYLKKGDAREGVDGGAKGVGAFFRQMGSNLTSRGSWRDIAHYSAAGLFPEKFADNHQQGTFHQGTGHHQTNQEDDGSRGPNSSGSAQTGRTRVHSENALPTFKETQHRVKGAQTSRAADRETHFTLQGNVPHAHIGVHDNPLPIVPLELSTRFDRVQKGLHTLTCGMSLMRYIHYHEGAGQAAKKFFTEKDHAGRGVFRRTLKGLSVIAPALLPVSPFMPIRMIGRELLGFVPIAFPKWLGGNLIWRRAANLMIGTGFRQHYHRRRADVRLATLRGEYQHYHNAEKSAEAAGNEERRADMAAQKEKVETKFQQELDRLRTDPEGTRRTDPYYYDKKIQILINEAKKNPHGSDAALLHSYFDRRSETDMLGREVGEKAREGKRNSLVETYLKDKKRPAHMSIKDWKEKGHEKNHEKTAEFQAEKQSPHVLFNAIAYDHIKDTAPELLRPELPEGASNERIQEALFHKLEGPDADSFIKQAVAVREIQFRDQHAKNFRIQDGAFRYDTLQRDRHGFVERDENGATRTIPKTADPDDYSRIDRAASAIYVKGHVKLEGGMKYAAQMFEIQRMTSPFTGKSWDKYNLDIRRMGEDGKDLYLSREQYTYLHKLVDAVGYGKGVDAWDYELYSPLLKAIKDELPKDVVDQYFMSPLRDDPNSLMIFHDRDESLLSANPSAIDPRNQVRRLKLTETTDSKLTFLGVDHRSIAHFGDGWHARVHDGAEILAYTDAAPLWDKSVKAYALRDANGNAAKDYFVVHEVYDRRTKGERESDPLLGQPDRIPEEHKYESWTIVDLRSDKGHKIRHNFLVNEREYKKVGAAEAERLLENRNRLGQKVADGTATAQEAADYEKATTLLVYAQSEFEKDVYDFNPNRDVYHKNQTDEAVFDQHYVITDIEHPDLRMQKTVIRGRTPLRYAEDGSIPEADRRYLEEQGLTNIDLQGTPGMPVVQRGLWVANKTERDIYTESGGDYFRIGVDPATGRELKQPITADEQRELEAGLDVGTVVQQGNRFYDVRLSEVEGVTLQEDGTFQDARGNVTTRINLRYNGYTDTYDNTALPDEEAHALLQAKQSMASLGAIHERGHRELREATGTLEGEQRTGIFDALTAKTSPKTIAGHPTYQSTRSSLESTQVTIGGVEKPAIEWMRQYGDGVLLGPELVDHLANELYANASVQRSTRYTPMQKAAYFTRDVLEKVGYYSNFDAELSREQVANIAQLRTIAAQNDYKITADYAGDLERVGMKGYAGKSFAQLFDDIVATRGQGESTTYNQARRVSQALWKGFNAQPEDRS